METSLLARFEKQIESLLSQFEQVKKENVELKGKMTALNTEKDGLQEKNDKTAAALEKMIDRLQQFIGNNGK